MHHSYKKKKKALRNPTTIKKLLIAVWSAVTQSLTNVVFVFGDEYAGAQCLTSVSSTKQSHVYDLHLLSKDFESPFWVI